MGAKTSSSSGHLIRLVGVVAGFLLLFVLVRGAVIPKDFGKLGHYRPAALEDNAGRPLSYAGQAECMTCHEDVANIRKASKHVKVSCEACHGANAAHAADPGAGKPAKLDSLKLCVICHAKDAAKPAAFPQIVASQHNADAGACTGCHQPHQPKI